MPKISVPARLEHLAAVNAFIGTSLAGQPEATLRQVELVLEELLVNVFSYAYPHDNGKAEITFCIEYLDGIAYFCFSVVDWGAEFNPFAEVPPPDINLDVDERPVGGLGVHLVRSLTAHYAYCREEGANRLRLHFTIPEKG
ncbi:MAG: ATP-binding protein [Desulfovibrionaceae bacterium]|nr:ATP-binding protein [Desulfovibrionaceae bacterium]